MPSLAKLSQNLVKKQTFVDALFPREEHLFLLLPASLGFPFAKLKALKAAAAAASSSSSIDDRVKGNRGRRKRRKKEGERKRRY